MEGAYTVVRKTRDADNNELKSILQELLAADIDISAREVGRRHSLFSSASSITRNPTRHQMVKEYQNRQIEMRSWHARLSKRSKQEIAVNLADQRVKISELERNLEVLVTGHVALIAAVAQVGGMSSLSKFYDNFRDVRQQLLQVGAISADTRTAAQIKLPDRTFKPSRKISHLSSHD